MVVESIVEVKVELVVLSVSIQLELVALSQPSANAIGVRTIKNNKDKKILFILFLTGKR